MQEGAAAVAGPLSLPVGGGRVGLEDRTPRSRSVLGCFERPGRGGRREEKGAGEYKELRKVMERRKQKAEGGERRKDERKEVTGGKGKDGNGARHNKKPVARLIRDEWRNDRDDRKTVLSMLSFGSSDLGYNASRGVISVS